MSPGPVSDSSKGPSERSPYIPGYVYPKGPRMCPCGHHEGYHSGVGRLCIHAHSMDNCGCKGLPPECFTPDEEMISP